MSMRMEAVFREQLQDRRRRLERALSVADKTRKLQDLLSEVDAALARMDGGSFGLCATCHEPIETDRLLADPLITLCLDHLTVAQQRALEQDLELAARIQSGLLPQRNLTMGRYQVSYCYEPLGAVSGDYCDLVGQPDGSFHFMFGDVAGKGVAASMLMAHLHATFRTLISIGQPLAQMLELASRLFCESTLATHFATLICGRALASGEVELCNAGHLPPLLVRGREVTPLESTSLPVGLFCSQEFTVQKLSMDAGDGLIIVTDGLSEARDDSDSEYGLERLSQQVRQNHWLPPQALIENLMEDLKSFQGGHPRTDDLSVLALRRTG